METKIYQRDLKMDHCPCFLIVLGYKPFSNFLIIYFMMFADPELKIMDQKTKIKGYPCLLPSVFVLPTLLAIISVLDDDC